MTDAPAKIAGLIARQPKGHALLGGLYNDPDVYSADLEKIFARHWLYAGHISQVAEPGDFFTYTVAEESVIVARGRDGVLRAMANVCRHRGSRVCLKPEGNARLFVCPYHAWSYDLSGALVSAREMGGAFDKSAHGLKQVHLRVAAGLIFISLAEEPLSFDHAGAVIAGAYDPYGWADAKIAHRETYTIDANWKLAVENYLECYHCAPAHKEYSELHALEKPLREIEAMNRLMHARTCAMGIDVRSEDDWASSRTGREAIFSFRYALYEGVKSGAPKGMPVAPLMGAFRDYDGGVTSAHFGPASFFVAYSDHGVVYRIVPKGPRRTEMELIWLVRADAVEGRDYKLADLTWLWRVTTEADKKITEDNQAGVNSRFYAPGPYAVMEPNAARYAAWYLGELAADMSPSDKKPAMPAQNQIRAAAARASG